MPLGDNLGLFCIFIPAMEGKKISSVVMIGAGNLAFHFAQAISDAGMEIIQVFSRTEASASRLGNLLGCNYTTERSGISGEGDLYILSLSDKAIVDFAGELNFPGKLVVHTSGGLKMDLLKSVTRSYGVIYPVQTFSKEKEVDFAHIPLCIEAVDKSVKSTLFDFSGKISSALYSLETDQRMKLHVAAVFACNFVNHMYSIASDILDSENLPFDLIKPLIQETADKINELSPSVAQTGPAKRNDQLVIEKHLDLLSFSPEYQKIYREMTESIINFKEQKNN
jgi:predicted short-subunit dehydrogenase-like oxidoreductase (DUF2520 family)